MFNKATLLPVSPAHTLLFWECLIVEHGFPLFSTRFSKSKALQAWLLLWCSLSHPIRVPCWVFLSRRIVDVQ